MGVEKPMNKDLSWFQQACRASSFIKPYRVEVALIMGMALLVAALGAVEPLVLKYIFDKLGEKSMDALLIGAVMLTGVGLGREAVGGVSNWLTWRVRLEVNSGLLEATVGRLHSLPLSYHRDETVGGIMTKLDKGINGFVGALSEIAFNVFPGLIYLFISLFIMLRLDWRLSIIVIFFAPMPALIGMIAANEQTRREKALMDRWTRVFSRLNEVLSGILTVKSFAMEEAEKGRFMKGVKEANSMVIKGVGIDTGVGAAKNTMALAARVLSLMAGCYLVINGEITAGTLVAFLGYAGGVFGPVQGLTGIYQTLRKATVSLDIIFSILDAHDHLADSPKALPLKGVRGEVIFDNVSFSYNNHRKVIDSISLHVRPGEIIALVGPSGAGKSTMMGLMQRLYDPSSGNICIDGVDLKELRQRPLRRQIGFVSQDALLFNDTVRNNIAYGRPEATDAEIVAAAKAANIHDLVIKLPHRYETLIGERGSLLSSGERQRVSIARAIVKDPPILILDEATSVLDAESEALIQDALERLMKERTTFIIAHRLSTVVRADRIIVLKDGLIIEEGCHEGLMRMDGYYASLVRCQTKGLIIDAPQAA